MQLIGINVRALGAGGWAGVLAVVVWCLPGWAAAEPAVIEGATMGTTYAISLPRPNMAPPLIQRRIDDLLEEINDRMSTYRLDSELSRLSANPSTGWIPVSADLHRVLATASRISDETAGAFDVTVGPLVNLWGFGPERTPATLPTPSALAQARARVGYRMIQLADNPPRARKARADLYIDLSAIAEGYAVDRIAELLEATGHDAYLVEIGGEVRARGLNAKARHWRVGVAWPVPVTNAVERVLELGDSALATSGDYRQYREIDGVRYSHEIDPATGEPVRHQLASVTVRHPSAMFADAYATGLMVLGPARGPAVAERLGLAALFLIREGEGFKALATAAFPETR